MFAGRSDVSDAVSLAGRTAIVTGGAGGLGLAIAQRLIAGGAQVILWDRDFSRLDDTAITPLHRATLDISDWPAVEGAFAEAVEVAGAVDILVNNAGINGPVTPSWDYPLDAWDAVMRINLHGVYYGCRAALPHMRARGYGRILNVASMAGKDGVPMISAYSAAKAGVIGLTKSIAKEVATDGVTVNAIAPAMVETGLQAEMTQEHIAAMKAKIPMGRFLLPPEAAEMVAWIVSDACSFTSGFTFDLSGARATY